MRRLLLLPALAFAMRSVRAQIPNTLLSSIPRPDRGFVQEGAQFGRSVAVDGGFTIVGAPLDELGRPDSGVVKVFDSATGALLHVIPNPKPEVGAGFGSAVAISGTRVVVGVPEDDIGPQNLYNAGSVYVYDLAGTTPTAPVATLNSPAPGESDNFGHAVAISGTRVVVGTTFNGGPFETACAYVYDLAGATPAVPVATFDNPGPVESDFFGYVLAISGTRVVVGAFSDDTGAVNTGSAYVYDLAGATPAVPVVTLNNPDPAENDFFGSAVAISGTRVVVGANSDDTGATGAGSAYVYDLAGATPTVPVVTLNNPGPAENDNFGSAVAISGTRIVVGANLDDTGAVNAGSAYVYDLAGATPAVPVATLDNPGPAESDFFGNAAAISGTRVVVGANLDDTGATDAGSAYLYDLASATPTVPVATLNNPGPALHAFGYAMALSGTRVVIGSSTNPFAPSAVYAGSAYVYDLAGAAPTVPIATLDNPDPAAYDHFANAVAISGTRLLVGASRNDTGASRAGIAYVYDLTSANPTVPVATLNNPTPALFDFFGYSVAISGTHAVVGALLDDTAGTDTGTVYVYHLAGPTPAVPVATLNNPAQPGQAYKYFGGAVAISGTRIIVGAYGPNATATDAGIAYVYDLAAPNPAVPVTTLHNPAPAPDDYFGWSVAISSHHAVVGAKYDDTAALNASGSAYVYDLAGATPSIPVVTLTNPQPGPYDNFGWSVAISGTRTVVGAHWEDTGATDSGSAYIYDLASATPAVPVATLHNPGPAQNDGFGYAVAIDGLNVLISVPSNEAIMPGDKGFVHLYGPHPLDQDSDGLRDAWELTHWPSIAGQGPADDTDRDGVVELLEMAFGMNPGISDAGKLPSAVIEGGYLTMTITKQSGASYQVQSAGTLASGQPNSFSAVHTTVLTDDPVTLKVQDTVPVSSAARRFLRVQVTAAP